MVRRQVRIRPKDDGKYLIEGIEGTKSFEKFDRANDFAIDELRRRVLDLGRLAGTSTQDLEIEIDDSVSSTKEGERLFLGRTITARLTGRPDSVVVGP
jgi:hypothetical protein